jgi:hypothetical protein
MRHRRRGYGTGRGRRGFDDFDEPGFGPGTGMGPGFGPGHGFGRGHGMGHFEFEGYRRGRPTTQERIAHLEEVQRDLEEMTADVASHIAWLRQRESEQTTT